MQVNYRQTLARTVACRYLPPREERELKKGARAVFFGFHHAKRGSLESERGGRKGGEREAGRVRLEKQLWMEGWIGWKSRCRWRQG